MNILFLHQGFPGPFLSLARVLGASAGHSVIALCQRPPPEAIPGVNVMRYQFVHGRLEGQHPLLLELESKVLRAEAVAEAAHRLQSKGWTPDLVIAHPGWGEALLVRTLWPNARLICHLDYYYAQNGLDFDFDPEFRDRSALAAARLPLKNTPMLHALQDADALWTSTEWQRELFPAWARPRIDVIHEGVDTGFFKPDVNAQFRIGAKNLTLSQSDEVLTYASLGLEPLRGFHVLMRALPEILRRRPKAHVVIMGGTQAIHGPAPQAHPSWLHAMLAEVGTDLDPSRVHLVGLLPRDAYRTVLQVSRAHLCLSYPFVPPGSLIDALACGVRLVGSRTGAIPELMPPGSDPYLAGFFDIPGLVNAACAALERRSRQCTSDRKVARTHAEQFYSRETQTLRLLALVERLRPASSPNPRAPAAAAAKRPARKRASPPAPAAGEARKTLAAKKTRKRSA